MGSYKLEAQCDSDNIAAQLAACAILTVGLFGSYLATANIINNTFKKAILPVGKQLLVK